MENNTNHTSYTRAMLLILALVLLVASIVGYSMSSRIQSNQNSAETRNVIKPSIVPTLIPYPVKGLFALKAQSGLVSGKVGDSFVIDLIATSGTDTVAGYDAILSYDKTAFERQSVQNKQDTFRIFTYERGAHVSISGTKNLQVTEPVRFKDTILLSFTFRAKQKGSYTFSLKAVANESSKLVNETTQVSYPEVSDFRLEIN
jgi:hypothetical protein